MTYNSQQANNLSKTPENILIAIVVLAVVIVLFIRWYGWPQHYAIMTLFISTLIFVCIHLFYKWRARADRLDYDSDPTAKWRRESFGVSRVEEITSSICFISFPLLGYFLFDKSMVAAIAGFFLGIFAFRILKYAIFIALIGAFVYALIIFKVVPI